MNDARRDEEYNEEVETRVCQWFDALTKDAQRRLEDRILQKGALKGCPPGLHYPWVWPLWMATLPEVRKDLWEPSAEVLADHVIATCQAWMAESSGDRTP